MKKHGSWVRGHGKRVKELEDIRQGLDIEIPKDIIFKEIRLGNIKKKDKQKLGL